MTEFDLLLTRALRARVRSLQPGEQLLESIQSEFHQRKETKIMKFSTKRILALAAALCLLTVSCYAAVQYTFVEMHSTADITRYADLADAEKEAGFDAKYIETFSNGYSFSRGGLGTMTEDQDPELPFLTIGYEKQGGRLTLTIHTVQEESKGYFTQTCKAVPPDYQPTEEDLAREASGEIYLSYGSDEVEIKQYESYRWQDGGLFYSLSGFDLNLGEEQLKSLAEEIKG